MIGQRLNQMYLHHIKAVKINYLYQQLIKMFTYLIAQLNHRRFLEKIIHKSIYQKHQVRKANKNITFKLSQLILLILEIKPALTNFSFMP